MPRQKSTAEKPAKGPAAKSADKRPAVAAVEKQRAPVEKRPAARNARPSDARQSDAQVDLSADEMHRLIQEAAYFKAKARNFAPGHEVQDWIEAESEVRLRFDAGSRRASRSA